MAAEKMFRVCQACFQDSLPSGAFILYVYSPNLACYQFPMKILVNISVLQYWYTTGILTRSPFWVVTAIINHNITMNI